MFSISIQNNFLKLLSFLRTKQSALAIEQLKQYTLLIKNNNTATNFLFLVDFFLKFTNSIVKDMACVIKAGQTEVS